MMRLLSTLVTIFTIVHADVVTSNSFNSRSSSFTSSGSGGDGKYYGQWTVGDLTCYIAQERAPDGSTAVVKQCRNGLLGMFHPMTADEEAIIEVEIQKGEAAKQATNYAIKEMNQEMQRRLQEMHKTMGQMMNMMQQKMQAAFGAFG